MFTFLQMLSSNILTQPAYFIGIMVFIGLLAMKKPFLKRWPVLLKRLSVSLS